MLVLQLKKMFYTTGRIPPITTSNITFKCVHLVGLVVLVFFSPNLTTLRENFQAKKEYMEIFE